MHSTKAESVYWLNGIELATLRRSRPPPAAVAFSLAAICRRVRNIRNDGSSRKSAVRSHPLKSGSRGGARADGGFGLSPLAAQPAKTKPARSRTTSSVPWAYPLVRSARVCSERPSVLEEKRSDHPVITHARVRRALSVANGEDAEAIASPQPALSCELRVRPRA